MKPKDQDLFNQFVTKMLDKELDLKELLDGVFFNSIIILREQYQS